MAHVSELLTESLQVHSHIKQENNPKLTYIAKEL